MTPEEIKEFFEGLIDDSLDEDVVYNLMDSAYTKRNESRFWQFLLKLDSSITNSPSDTWQTEKSLPTDFSRPYKVFGGASGDNEYDGIPFEDILKYIGYKNKYTIDLANSKMRFLGGPASALTIYLFYQYVPTSLFGLSDAQKTATTTIVWPSRFRKLLAYDMANIWMGGGDADDFTKIAAPYHRAEALELRRAMENWDNSVKMKMRNNSASPNRAVPSDRADVVDW